jgi:uncharacterized membrane protein YeaQ/YmgE (transglycosylase-associated protein family)
MPHILIILIVGAIAGWLGGALVNSDNGSLLLDIFIGIVGGYIGYWLFGSKLDLVHGHPLMANKQSLICKVVIM